MLLGGKSRTPQTSLTPDRLTQDLAHTSTYDMHAEQEATDIDQAPTTAIAADVELAKNAAQTSFANHEVEVTYIESIDPVSVTRH